MDPCRHSRLPSTGCACLVMFGTKFVILRHQTFDEAQVTSDSVHGANKESLSAFVEDVETSVGVDFPEDEEHVGGVLGCGSSDLSDHGGTEAAQHEDEKMTAAASSQKL
ncbi:hypothetical protein GRJ2_002028000 [Grus japonensis]|uniref:Uncharacterized protein n=1 Tax=Grus japonensis TaxID=30415 RepID=A0ABC9XG78_GRUJA